METCKETEEKRQDAVRGKVYVGANSEDKDEVDLYRTGGSSHRGSSELIATYTRQALSGGLLKEVCEACKFAEYMLREETWGHKEERDKAQELLAQALAKVDAIFNS